MYTIFTNEKLGMQVEQVRLAEIRQQIEAQRLGDAVDGNRFGIKSLIGSVSRFIGVQQSKLATQGNKHTVTIET